MATVSPRQRTVQATYRITETAAVRGADPLLCHRTKHTYFDPRQVTVELVVTPDRVGETTRVYVTGWVLKDGVVQVGRPGRAFFNKPTDRIYQPSWLGDYFERLWKEIEAKYLRTEDTSTQEQPHE